MKKTAEEILKDKPAIFTPAGRCVRIEDAESAMHEFANQSRWISIDEAIPIREGYFDVMFEDGTVDEKPFRIRPSRNILGFMTENKVIKWKPTSPQMQPREEGEKP